ncbi:MAG: enoyl-CoA hydratase/isomerase family protein [Myxococcota bacterium]
MADELRFETPEPGIAVLTLHRPERLNALNAPLMEQLDAALGRVRDDADLRVCLLRGAPRTNGTPCFSAGVDLKAFAEGQGVGFQPGIRITDTLAALPKPTIAVIDGVCTTGGAELAVACHLRLVAPTARISDWHLRKLGTGLGAWGASTRWARLVGAARTRELFLTGREIDGEEALRIGFASRLVPSASLFETALSLAREIATLDPRGVAMTLAHLARVDDQSEAQALAFAAQAPDWFGIQPDLGQDPGAE